MSDSNPLTSKIDVAQLTTTITILIANIDWILNLPRTIRFQHQMFLVLSCFTTFDVLLLWCHLCKHYEVILLVTPKLCRHSLLCILSENTQLLCIAERLTSSCIYTWTISNSFTFFGWIQEVNRRYTDPSLYKLSY